MKRGIIFILTILAVTSNLHLDVKYRNILSGAEELTSEKTREIYYQEFESSFNKDIYRYKIFEETLKSVITHNKKNLSWTQGINDFSDMTWEEFKQSKLMAPQNCSATTFDLKVDKQSFNYPTSFEWNDYGVVSPVKQQGQCGSCWAFSTVGTMEAHWRILGKGKDTLFAQQQLVDCAGGFNNFGCDGGLPSQAFEYIRSSGGLMLSQSYPYVGVDGKCVFNVSKAVGYIKYGSFNITVGDENQLADRLYNIGPISIAYNAMDDFDNYKSGVYIPTQPCGTGPNDVNHAVVATGYGYQNGLPFWNVKNSWGPSWGNKGYFKILRGNNTCAIAQCNSYPLIDRPNSNNLRAY